MGNIFFTLVASHGERFLNNLGIEHKSIDNVFPTNNLGDGS